jgi:hypothetical protein
VTTEEAGTETEEADVIEMVTGRQDVIETYSMTDVVVVVEVEDVVAGIVVTVATVATAATPFVHRTGLRATLRRQRRESLLLISPTSSLFSSASDA